MDQLADDQQNHRKNKMFAPEVHDEDMVIDSEDNNANDVIAQNYDDNSEADNSDNEAANLDHRQADDQAIAIGQEEIENNADNDNGENVVFVFWGKRLDDPLVAPGGNLTRGEKFILEIIKSLSSRHTYKYLLLSYKIYNLAFDNADFPIDVKPLWELVNHKRNNLSHVLVCTICW